MAVLAEYRPVQAPGANAENFISGYERGASLMERKQRMQMLQEQQDQERAKFVAQLPVMVAKQQADITSAAASVANAARVEQLRAQAAQSSVDYNGEFFNIMNIPDDKTRSDELGLFMGKISWLDNPALPEYQGFAKAVREERAKSFSQALTNMKLDEQLELEKQRAVDRAEIAKIAAMAKTDTAQIAADSRQEVAATTAQGRFEQAKLKLDRQFAIDSAIEKRDEAMREGNREKAQIYQDHINKLNSFAVDPKNNPLPASVPTKVGGMSDAKEMVLPSGAKVLLRVKENTKSEAAKK